jgi:hypothetical protein
MKFLFTIPLIGAIVSAISTTTECITFSSTQCSINWDTNTGTIANLGDPLSFVPYAYFTLFSPSCQILGDTKNGLVPSQSFEVPGGGNFNLMAEVSTTRPPLKLPVWSYKGTISSQNDCICEAVNANGIEACRCAFECL